MNKKNYWKNLIEKDAALDPIDRISEVLYGLIMVLTFTGTISVSSEGKQEVMALLWAALGCNFAWALVDSIMFLMNQLLARGHSFKELNKIFRSKTEESARKILREDIDSLFSDLMDDKELDNLVNKIKQLPEPTKKSTLVKKDYLIAIQIFILVFIGTLPVAAPFLFINEVSLAMRASNLVALILLFAGGFSLAKYAGFKPITGALSYTAIGILLIIITIALGG